MDYALAKQINKLYLLKCKDSTGKLKLIGGGQLHKFIGMGGSEICETMYKDALTRTGGNFEIHLKRGITVRFNRRKTTK